MCRRSGSLVLLSGLIALSLLVRIYESHFHPLIANDGITFIDLAKHIFSSNYGETFRSTHHHPFYPFLIKTLSIFSDNYEAIARIISLVSGSLLIIPIFFLARGLYGPRVALVSSLFIIFDRNLAFISTQVLSESLYLFLLCLGIYCGWLVLERTSLVFFTTISFSLAYLTKPEGILGLAIFFLWYLINQRFVWKATLAHLIRAGVSIIIIFLAVASPYLIFLHNQLGTWTLSGKSYGLQAFLLKDTSEGWLSLTKDGRQTLSEALYDPNSEVGRHIKEKGRLSLMTNFDRGNFKKFFKDSFIYLIDMALPWVVFLSLVGLFRQAWSRDRLQAELYLLSFFAYPMILFSLFFLPKPRHLLPMVPIVALWAAKGISELAAWVHETLKGSFGICYSLQSNKGLAIIAVIFLLPSVLFIFNPNRAKPDTWVRDIGEEIRKNLPPNPIIMTTDSKISYYAGGVVPILSPYEEDFSKTIFYARYNKVQYIAIDEQTTPMLSPQLAFLLDDTKAPKDILKLIYKSNKQPRHKILLYEILNSER